MNILVTLNSGLGADTGPNFNLTADVGSVTPSTATKAELLAGKFVDVTPSATQITVTSIGVCTTSIVLNIVGQTTTTTTTAPQMYSLGYDVSDFFAACIDYGVTPSTFYSATGTALGVGTYLYTNQSLSVIAPDGYYSNGTNWWRVRFGEGVIVTTGSCSTTTSTTSTSTTAAPTSTTTSTSTSTSTSTTTLSPVLVNLGYDAIIGWQACYSTTSAYYLAAGEILENGTYLYTDTGLSIPPTDGYYSNGSNYWYVISGELTDETPCPTTSTTSTTSTSTTSTSTTSTSTTSTSTSTSTTSTSTSTTSTTTAAPTSTSTTSTTTAAPTSTTTTLGYVSFSLTYSNTAGETACTDFANPTNRVTYYASPGSTLTTGTILYTTTALNTPVANGFYSNGTHYWNTAAGAGNLQNQTLCASGTTTTTGAPTTTTTTTAAPQCNYDGLTIVCDAITTTTTTGGPTTTTTTAAPTTFTLAFAYSATSGNDACDNWDGVVGRTSYTSNCSVAANGCTVYNLGTTTPVTPGWYAYAGTYWYAAPDDDGLLSSQTTCSASTTTTTAAPTTTTTTAAPAYDLYVADQYECGQRNLVGTTVIAFPTGTSVNFTRFYNSNTDIGTYAYQPYATSTSGPGLIMNTTAYLTIPFACPIP